MNRTPDIRTRAYLPRWCSEVTIKYCTPTFNARGVVALLANSGMICGLGDNRQEKGNGSFGSYSVHSAEDMGDAKSSWDEIVAEGREVQELAYEYPECYDDDDTRVVGLCARRTCAESRVIFFVVWSRSGAVRRPVPRVTVRRLCRVEFVYGQSSSVLFGRLSW